MNHIWSVLCEKSSIDTETNLLSLFSCIEELSVVVDKQKMEEKGGKVVIPANFQLVSFWTIDDKEKDHNLRNKVELLSPNGEVLNQFNKSFDIKAGATRFRNRANISGMPIVGEGRYYLKLYQVSDAGENLVAQLPVEIKISYKILDKNKQ